MSLAPALAWRLRLRLRLRLRVGGLLLVATVAGWMVG